MGLRDLQIKSLRIYGKLRGKKLEWFLCLTVNWINSSIILEIRWVIKKTKQNKRWHITYDYSAFTPKGCGGENMQNFTELYVVKENDWQNKVETADKLEGGSSTVKMGRRLWFWIL